MRKIKETAEIPARRWKKSFARDMHEACDASKTGIVYCAGGPMQRDNVYKYLERHGLLDEYNVHLRNDKIYLEKVMSCDPADEGSS